MIWPESYAVVDIETTGLTPKRANIIEIGIKVILGGEAAPTESRLVHIATPVPRTITKITNITTEMLQDGWMIKSVLEWLDRETKYLPVIGHNFIQFDAKFINRERERLKMSTPWREDVAFIDTAALYKGRAIRRTLTAHESLLEYQLAVLAEHSPSVKFSLAAACEEFSIATDGAHRAAADVDMTHQVYLKLRELLSGSTDVHS